MPIVEIISCHCVIPNKNLNQALLNIRRDIGYKENLINALRREGFYSTLDRKGNMYIKPIHEKMILSQMFLQSLAPCIAKDSHIKFMDREKECNLLTFDGKKMHSYQAEIRWKPIKYTDYD